MLTIVGRGPNTGEVLVHVKGDRPGATLEAMASSPLIGHCRVNLGTGSAAWSRAPGTERGGSSDWSVRAALFPRAATRTPKIIGISVAPWRKPIALPRSGVGCVNRADGGVAETGTLT